MKTLRKRKHISYDVNYLKNHEFSKKLKVQDENQSLIDWHEVKVILDATVVEKYLNNKKSVSDITKTIPKTTKRTVRCEEKSVLCNTQANKKISQVFPEKNVIVKLVKLELLEDLRFNISTPKEIFDIENVSIKQENYKSVQDTENLDNDDEAEEFINDNYQCEIDIKHAPPMENEDHEPIQGTEYLGNDEESAASIDDNYQCNVDIKHASSAEHVAEEVSKIQTFESYDDCEEVTVGHEFKHEVSIPNCHNTELINQENITEQIAEEVPKFQAFESHDDCEEVTIGHEFKHEESIPNCENIKPRSQENITPSNEKTDIRRSSRQRKKRPDLDDYDCEVVKKSRNHSHVIKKHTVKAPAKISNSNSKSKTLSGSNRNEFLVSGNPQLPKEKEKVQYHCDYCDHRANKKSHLSSHIISKHQQLSPNGTITCLRCNVNFKDKSNFDAHQRFCLSRLLVNCKFCSVSVSTKQDMTEHLRIAHAPDIPFYSIRQFVDDLWLAAVTDVTTTLDRAGNTTYITDFGKTLLKVQKYYFEKKYEMTILYCTLCNLSYDETEGQKMTCPNCKTQLTFQCQTCKMTEPDCQSIWKHLRTKGSSCDISENLSFIIDKEQLNATNQVAPVEKSQQNHKCEICDYKGVTELELCQHILYEHSDDDKKDSNAQKVVLRNKCWTCYKCKGVFYNRTLFAIHKRRCGCYIRLPCKFCPRTCESSQFLKDHVSTMHVDELDGANVEDAVEEAMIFKNMIKEINAARLGYYKKYRMNADKTFQSLGCWLNGIQSILKPGCLHCPSIGIQTNHQCVECHRKLIFQCLRCDKRFLKYSTGWEHVTQTCRNRMFTLVTNEKEKDSAEKDSSNILHCDYCGFKNRNKSILSRHMLLIHNRRPAIINDHHVCNKCRENFDNWEEFSYHKAKCRAKFIYNCHFCNHMVGTFEKMEKHVIQMHAYLYGRKDGVLDEAVNEILRKIESTKVADKRISYSFAKKFSETVKLITFYCSKCVERFDEESIRGINFAEQCPKCRSAVSIVCKSCHKVYATWEAAVRHLRRSLCRHRYFERLELPSCLQDHTYARENVIPKSGKS